MKPSDPLDQVLETWNPAVPDEAGFREGVWARIASQAGDGEHATGRVFRIRPVVLAAAAAVVLGFSIGVLTPRATTDGAHEAYFARINPLAEVR